MQLSTIRRYYQLTDGCTDAQWHHSKCRRRRSDGRSLQGASVRLVPVSAQGLSTTQLQARPLSHNKAQRSSWSMSSGSDSSFGFSPVLIGVSEPGHQCRSAPPIALRLPRGTLHFRFHRRRLRFDHIPSRPRNPSPTHSLCDSLCEALQPRDH